MKRLYVLALTASLALSACLPSLSGAPANPSPTLDLRFTAAAMAATMAAQTMESLSTPTLLPTSTFTPIPRGTTTTLLPTITGSETVTPSTTLTVTVTPTQPSFEPITIDKLPPGTAYGPIRLENRSGTQVDVSLHCTTLQGLKTILEYNGVRRNMTIDAPLGNYVYVAYIGGRKYVGGFAHLSQQKLTLTFYEDRVAVH